MYDMAKINTLLVVTNEEKNVILKHFNMNEKDLQEKIDFLIEQQIKNGFPQDGKVKCLKQMLK